MSSIIYLLVTSAKNSIISIIKKPSKLIIYIFLFVMIGFMIYASLLPKQNTNSLLDIYYLKGIFLGFILLFSVLTISKGMESGDTFFDMSDVNMLFVSPISPKKVLIYGVIRLAKTAFLASFFFLLQIQNLKNIFNVGFDGVLIILLTYVLCMVLTQIISLLIYSLTNGKPKRKQFVKLIGVILVLPALILFLTKYISTNNFGQSLIEVLKTPYVNLLPVAGWGATAALETISGNFINAFLYYGIIVATGVFAIVILTVSNSDYYEDVLCATETNYEKKRALSEGNINAATKTNRKIIVSNTGLSGYGASAIFGKHMRESLRENRLFIFSPQIYSMLLSVVVIIIILNKQANIFIILSSICAMQIKMISFSRGLKELYMPYIYLIPEKSFSKILWGNAENIFRILCDAILLFAISGFYLKENILIIIMSILTYTLFSLMLISINYFSIRLTEINISSVIMTPLFLFSVMLVMLPGIICAMVVYYILTGVMGSISALGILCGWELLLSIIFFWFSKGVLDSCDMPVMINRQ